MVLGVQQLASHGLFNVVVEAEGDIHIDDHHTNEDIALALGTALAQALGDRKGIYRFGDFTAPLDEALVHVVLVIPARSVKILGEFAVLVDCLCMWWADAEALPQLSSVNCPATSVQGGSSLFIELGS